MRILVTGGAGFIGSHLCDRLLALGAQVWCVDNLRLGRRRNIAHLTGSPAFRFVELDVLDRAALEALFREGSFDEVFHLAANSDIAAGTADIRLDLDLNQLTTVAIIEAMRANGVKRLFFASTSAIFGETDAVLHEDFAPLEPISFYGASKLAAEAYVSVFAHTFGGRAVVLRFPNVVGERATHGVIYDFLRKLEADRSRLEVLGDGNQSKPYCQSAFNWGSDAILVPGGSVGAEQSGLKEVDFSSTVHLVFDELELGDLPLCLAVGPRQSDCGVDGGFILGDAIGE
jgi:UDP-glucose 4-epimerase